jgi:ketosteroid isomerase-like protein
MIMKKTMAALWVCMIVLIGGVAQTKAVKGGASTGGVTKALIQETLDAWSTMDTNKIAPFYSEAPENIFFDVAPMQFKGWGEWAKGAQNLFSDYKSFKLRLTTEPIIHNEGNWAWGTYLWHLDAVHKDGKTETLDGRDTAIWQKQGNRWLTVHEHVSIPVSMPATENK